MNVGERLRRIVALLPPDASITLNLSDIRNWLDEPAATVSEPEERGDLTVADVAKLMRRKPSTIRGWFNENRFTEAYLFNGREWRVTRAGLAAFLANERRRTHTKREARDSGNLSSWRESIAKQ
jgi:hypothetical protein